MTADPLAEAARLIAALCPNWQLPERFHETKAEVARHRRLLASASRPPRRRRAEPDARQGRLPLIERLTP